MKSSVVTTIIRSVPWLFTKPGKETLRGRKNILSKELVGYETQLNLGSAKGLYVVTVINTQTGQQAINKIVVN